MARAPSTSSAPGYGRARRLDIGPRSCGRTDSRHRHPRHTDDVAAAVSRLVAIGYVHRGDLGVTGREAFKAPDEDPVRNVYVCQQDTLNVRNHLAVRDVLRRHPALRDERGAVKLTLASDPDLAIETHIARKSRVLQKVLAASDLTSEECLQILRLNDPSAWRGVARGRSVQPDARPSPARWVGCFTCCLRGPDALSCSQAGEEAR